MRRWAAITTLAFTVVCLFSLPVGAVDETSGVATSKPPKAPKAPSTPVIVEVSDSATVHLRHLSEDMRRLESLQVLDVEIPEIPVVTGVHGGAPRVIVINNGADTTSIEDSIYAVEITAGAGSVDITDASGRHLKVIGQSAGIFEPGPRDHRITGRREDIFHVFSDVITIEPDEIINGDVVSIFGGRVVVLGRVNGTVSSIFGTIDIEGTVEDGAIAPFGSVHIGPSGAVGGDVVASEINKDPGGRIGGIRNELFFKIFGQDWQPSGQLWLRQTFTVIVIMKILFWVFLVLLAHALAARNVAKVKARLQRSFFKCFFMGLLVQILFIPAVLVLLVTIIGIPVAIFLLPLMVVAALVLAHASIGLFIGEKINENTALPLPSALSQTVVGLMTVQTVPLIAVISMWLTQVGAIAPVFRIVTFVLVGLSLIVGYVVITLGVGAVTMTRFGTRPKDESDAPTPDPTPLPVEDPPAATAKASPLPRPRTDEPGTASAV